MPGKRFVQESVIRVEDLQHRMVVLEQVLEKQHRFLEDRLTEFVVEHRKQLLVLLVEFVEVADVQPLCAELDGQRPGALVLQHPRRLRRQHLRITQSARGGGLAQLDALATRNFDVLGSLVKASKASVVRHAAALAATAVRERR